MESNLLSSELMLKLECIGEADIVVAIDRGYGSVENAVKAVAIGLARYFPELKCILLKNKEEDENSDQVFMNTDLYEARELNFIYTPFIPAHRIILDAMEKRKTFLKQAFHIADILNCEACMIAGGDLNSINPLWVETLLKPVIKAGYDIICPVYNFSRTDLLIRNNLTYPLVRGLYNIELFHPDGEDFGISIDLARTFLEKNIWDSELDINIWMTTTAICEGFDVGQAFLGAKKFKGNHLYPGSKDEFQECVKAIFTSMSSFREFWTNDNDDKIKHLPVFSFPFNLYPEEIPLNSQEFINRGKDLYDKSAETIKEVLQENTFRLLQDSLVSLGKGSISITDDLWIDIICDYSCYLNLYETDYKFTGSLTPLYFFRAASFLEETASMSRQEFEEKILSLSNKFLRIKEELEKGQLNNI